MTCNECGALDFTGGCETCITMRAIKVDEVKFANVRWLIDETMKQMRPDDWDPFDNEDTRMDDRWLDGERD